MVISIKRCRRAFSRSAWVPSRQPGRAGGLPSTSVMGRRGRLGGEVRGDTSARHRVKSGFIFPILEAPWGITLHQILQEVRRMCKTRNQLSHTKMGLTSAYYQV